jgi:hypothetical protein
MNFMEQFTERLNLNISPQTYNRLKEEASNEGRKVGNMVRVILDHWAGENNSRENDKEKKNEKTA